MQTAFTLYRADGTDTEGFADLPEEPTLDQINAVVRPLIGTLPTRYYHIEHVSVLYEGEQRDMFVDEDGWRKRLPCNEAATTIYRNAWMTQHPDLDPDNLPANYGVRSVPYIFGDAVLFHRRIWF